MSQPFNEAFISAHRDPLDPTHQGFDYDQVDEALNPGSTVPVSLREYSGLGSILQWFRGCWRLEPGADAMIGRRAIAMMWVVRPDLFEGMSQSQIANLLGCHKMAISRHASEFSHRFGLRNPGQLHGWNYKQDTKADAASGGADEERADGTEVPAAPNNNRTGDRLRLRTNVNGAGREA